MKLLFSLLMLQILVCNSVSVRAAEDLASAPFKHCNKYSRSDDLVSFFFKDLAQELGRRLNASVEHVEVSKKRCLALLKTGQVDFMLYDHITDELSGSMDLIHSSNIDNVVFMVRKKDGDWLLDYTDLENKKVGLLEGYSYFPTLNGDSGINKFIVMSSTQLPKVLLGGRVDVFVTHQSKANDILLSYPDIVKASYNVSDFEMGFIIISKESPLHHRLGELKRIAFSMLNDGYVEEKIKKHIPNVISPFSKNPILE